MSRLATYQSSIGGGVGELTLFLTDCGELVPSLNGTQNLAHFVGLKALCESICRGAEAWLVDARKDPKRSAAELGDLLARGGFPEEIEGGHTARALPGIPEDSQWRPPDPDAFRFGTEAAATFDAFLESFEPPPTVE